MHMLTALTATLICTVTAFLLPATAHATANTPATITDFSCSGSVHAAAIDLWDHVSREYVAKLISQGMNRDGDVYVLYNTQEYLQSFVEMTRRCKDRQQLAELVATLNPVFKSLRPLPDATATRGWVCTGGQTCTLTNHMLGKEVQLCSAQFLGLLGAVATDIVETIPEEQRTADEKAFLFDTATTIATQVDNWLSPAYFKWVATRAAMTPADAVDGQSKYFFADRDLWFMTSLADLAELDQSGISLSGAGASALKSLQTKRNQIGNMFNLFLARTTLADAAGGARAEIDLGYWRNYADSKYAAYSATVSPVLCQKNALGIMQETFRVDSKGSYIDPNLGWDLSHARRLVPALDTFIRNRSNLASVFSYDDPSFDPAKLQREFANQIVAKTWNKDGEYPLFSNFWDGSNGWYRAGYDNGTGGCRAGEAPYSLAWSFPTGGYPQWGAVNSTIQSLSRRLGQLFNATDARSMAFVAKYYPQLQLPGKPDSTAPSNRQIWMLSVLSSLVGN